MGENNVNRIARMGSLIALVGIAAILVLVIFKYFRSGEFDTRTLLYGTVMMGLIYVVIRYAGSAKAK